MQLTSRRKTLKPKFTRDDQGNLCLLAPALGLWRDRPSLGTPVMPGMSLGCIEVLGVLHDVVVPEKVAGVCSAVGEGLDPDAARIPLTFGTPMLVIDPKAGNLGGEVQQAHEDNQTTGAGLCAPSSGRFYRRAAPHKPFFIEVGQEVREGQVVGLLEIMKTFHRITFTGPGLPSPARVVAIEVEDGDDVRAGDVLVRVEPI